MATTVYPAQLEIDHDRGVIYVHSAKDGRTLMRICNLPRPIPDPTDITVMLDVTHMKGATWVVKEKL